MIGFGLAIPSPRIWPKPCLFVRDRQRPQTVIYNMNNRINKVSVSVLSEKFRKRERMRMFHENDVPLKNRDENLILMECSCL